MTDGGRRAVERLSGALGSCAALGRRRRVLLPGWAAWWRDLPRLLRPVKPLDTNAVRHDRETNRPAAAAITGSRSPSRFGFEAGGCRTLSIAMIAYGTVNSSVRLHVYWHLYRSMIPTTKHHGSPSSTSILLSAPSSAEERLSGLQTGAASVMQPAAGPPRTLAVEFGTDCCGFPPWLPESVLDELASP